MPNHFFSSLDTKRQLLHSSRDMHATSSPFISIIIPTLNEENYIPRLLKSLTVQTLKNFEVIVSDGNSDDETKNKTLAFAHLFPLQLINSTCRNPSFQRNTGAKVARGKYLLFLDADTFVHTTFIEDLTTLLYKEKPDYAATSIDFDSQELFDHFWSGMMNTLKPFFNKLGKPHMAGHNLIFSRTAFYKLRGFNPRVVHSEDFDLVERAAKKHLKSRTFLKPTVIVSSRRFDREGRLTVVTKYVQAYLYRMLNGPIYKEIFQYEMGGKTIN